MLMTSERRPAIRTLRGWAIHVLQEAGAIRECEEHGWMQDRADPHARERAFDAARRDPPEASPPMKRQPRSARCWNRSAIPPQNVPLTKEIVDYLSARDICPIAPFSRYTTPFGAELPMNSATKARPISSCSIAPKRPGIRRPNQAT